MFRSLPFKFNLLKRKFPLSETSPKHFLLPQVLILFLVVNCQLSISQVAPTKFFIQFTDKANTPFFISNPNEFLSQRALNRRIIQNITIDEFDLPVNPTYVQQIAATGAIVIARSKWMNGVLIQTADSAVFSAVNSLPFVVSDIPVFKTDIYNKVSPAKWEEINETEFFKTEKVLSAEDYGAGLNQIDMVGGLGLHNAGYKGQGKLIAVLDAGFPGVFTNPAFDSLNNRNGIIAVKDFVSPGNNATQGNISAHGAYVLSIMAANMPGQMIGTAPAANYVLLRTEDAPTENLIEEYNWVIGAEYADSIGADIINSSLGYNTFDQPYMNHTFADMDGHSNISTIGANKAASKGILVSISAGNEGNSAWGRISSPSDADSALAIGAVDSSGNYASLSGRGPSANGSIKPNVASQGFATAYVNTTGIVLHGNGTSFSSPIISGMAACLWQAIPDRKSNDLKKIIETSASQHANPDSLKGYGVPNFSFAQTIAGTNQPQNVHNDELLLTYPNPFKEEAHILFYSTHNQQIEIRITDLWGKIISNEIYSAYKMSINNYTYLDAKDWKQGMYIVGIKTEKGQYFQKILKN